MGMSPDMMTSMMQMGVGMGDKMEGTFLSLLNFIKDFGAAKQAKMTGENIDTQVGMIAKGQNPNLLPTFPTDKEVSGRVWQDLNPFGGSFLV